MTTIAKALLAGDVLPHLPTVEQLCQAVDLALRTSECQNSSNYAALSLEHQQLFTVHL
jgi:hypothetical protein